MEITELPRPLAGFHGAASRQEDEGEEKEEKEEKRRGLALFYFFLQLNHCSAVHSIVAATSTRSPD